MAHNLEYNVNRNSYSFYSRKQLAWHGLGQVIQEAVTPDEALKLSNLDYEVALRPIYASFIPEGCIVRGKEPHLEVYDSKTNEFVSELKKKGALVTTNHAVCRMDTLDPLAVVGSKYTPVQNKDSIDFIYNILKQNPDISNPQDIVIETAGALGNGSRIFVTAKLPKGFKIGNEEENTELYIVFTNSHDGTSSLTAMVTPVRVVCNNTLTSALKSNVSKVSFRHTKNIHDSLKQGAQLLSISYNSFETNRQLYNHLLTIKVDDKIIEDLIFKSMLDNDKYLTVKKLDFKNIPNSLISTRMANQIVDMRDYIHAGVGQKSNVGTAYWAYMGMNSYINNGINYKDLENKFTNLIEGTSLKLDTKILNNVMQLS